MPRGFQIATVVARFNEHITTRLLDGATAVATERGVARHDVFWAPGSFELPVIALHLARSGNYDAIVCLGAVIRHETDHYLHVATAAATGIQRVALDTGMPCLFGVLTCDNEEQALARSGDKRNVGAEAMEAAIQAATTIRSIPGANSTSNL
jgi:6,7-dimethyl-8-ribityllumazine synthase